VDEGVVEARLREHLIEKCKTVIRILKIVLIGIYLVFPLFLPFYFPFLFETSHLKCFRSSIYNIQGLWTSYIYPFLYFNKSKPNKKSGSYIFSLYPSPF